jgi:hypothetical protein
MNSVTAPITRLKVRILTIGMHPDERLVEIIQADGTATDCFVWKTSLTEDGLVIRPMERRADGAILVELPQETVAGYWRVWVAADSLRDEVNNLR